MSNFYVGQKVVCVEPLLESGLRLNATYIVSSVGMPCSCTPVIGVGIDMPPNDHKGRPYIIGVRTTCICGSKFILESMEWSFRATRFRPLDTLTATMDRIESEGAPVEVEISEPVLNRSN